jgi:26S proteasome regulatory subunit N6
MSKKTKDALNILNSQMSLKYQGHHLEAMRAIAVAVNEQNLLAFEKAKQDYQEEIGGDLILMSHTNNLYQSLLEDNLCKILEPYSEVQIEYVAQ